MTSKCSLKSKGKLNKVVKSLLFTQEFDQKINIAIFMGPPIRKGAEQSKSFHPEGTDLAMALCKGG